MYVCILMYMFVPSAGDRVNTKPPTPDPPPVLQDWFGGVGAPIHEGRAALS